MRLQKSLCLFVLVCLLSSAFGAVSKLQPSVSAGSVVFGGLADVNVTVRIVKIRALDKNDVQVHRQSFVERGSDPSFFVKLIVNGEEFTSPVWDEMKYVYAPGFAATVTVPVDQGNVSVKIQLWDRSTDGDILCDIGDKTDDVSLVYNIMTGHWSGDDYLGDKSGYGRLNGCDDGKIYGGRRDAELWFGITQSDTTADGVPSWMKVNVYHLDSAQDYSTYDPNADGIPLPWDWKWGFDPFASDSHYAKDPDGDALTNRKEYQTSQWGSDPYCKDLFLELDQMMIGPHGEGSLFPDASKEILYTAYDRYNVVYHLDDGSWNGSGSDMIPFQANTTWEDLDAIYNAYFLHNDQRNWRRGVFHYGLLVYHQTEICGSAFGSNAFQISSQGMERFGKEPWLNRTVVYASAYMHETGHTLGFFPIPGHNQFSGYPWQLGWWLTRSYKSCMNYGYMYYTVDYSDGSRPFGDYNDWQRMDLTNFLHG